MVAGAAFALFWLTAGILGVVFYADLGFRIFPAGGGDLVEFSTNAFFPWTFEPLSSALLGKVPMGYLVYLSLLFSAGALGTFSLASWCARERGREIAPGTLVFVSLAFSATLLFLFAGDSVIISLLAILPWHIASLSLSKTPGSAQQDLRWPLIR